MSFESELQHMGTVKALQFFQLHLLKALEHEIDWQFNCQSSLLLAAIGYWIREHELPSDQIVIVEHLETSKHIIELDVKGETIQPLTDSYEYEFNFRFNQGPHNPT